jgi:hypothetical protein
MLPVFVGRKRKKAAGPTAKARVTRGNSDVARVCGAQAQKGGRADGQTPRDTSPYRLSAMSGEKVNQFADFENRQSQIANLKSPDHPITRLS